MRLSSPYFLVTLCLLSPIVYADESLSEIIVTDSQLDSGNLLLGEFDYHVDEFPGSVEIITEETLPHSTDSIRLEDFAETIPGVQTGRLQAGLGSDVYIRGFSTAGFLYKDGLVDNRRYYIRDPSSIDRIEIIKGRDSVLFGSGSAGGTVNYVIKKPLEQSQHQVKVSVGNPSHARFVIDSTGPVNNSDSIFFRFIAMKQNVDVGRANVDDDRLMIMPSLLFKSERSSLRILAEYSEQDREFDFDTVLRYGEPVYNTSFSGPRNNSKRIHKSLDIDFHYDFSKNWKGIVKANRYQVDRDELLSGFWYKEDEDTLIGYYREIENDHSQHSVKAELKGKFDIGNTSHFSSIGFELNKMKSILTSRRFSGFTLDILNPVFDFPTPTPDQMRDYDYDEGDSSKSFYVHDKVYVGNHWTLRAGFRHSKFYRDFFRLSTLTPLTDTSTLSSSFGATYQPNNRWALYAGSVQSFSPNIGRSKTNDYFAPREARQHEVGFRYHNELSKRSLKAGLYNITQSNLTTTDPDDRDFQILAGERQVTGLEISTKTLLTNNLSLSLTYSLMDGKITKNNDGLEGNTPGNMPKHSGSLNLGYTIPDGIAKGMKIDVGLIGVSKRQVSDKNKFTVDGYERYDLNVNYPINKKTTVNFSVKNITDKDYIAAPIVEDVLVEGYPRRILLSVAHNF